LDPLEKELAEIVRAKSAVGMSSGVSYGALRAPILGKHPAPYMTIKQLVREALDTCFRDGATVKQLIGFFKESWDREIRQESLSPQLSRLRTDGVIERRGHVWFLTSGRNSAVSGHEASDSAALIVKD